MNFEFRLPDCCQVLVFRSILQLYDDQMKLIKAHIYTGLRTKQWLVEGKTSLFNEWQIEINLN